MNTHAAFELPLCPITREEYERLYAFNHGRDNQDQEGRTWEEIRIKPGSTEADVYRLLPAATDFEYGGYVTSSRIRYIRGENQITGMRLEKPCTFHSHPTKNPYLADIPSLQDIHTFLFYRHLRSITVGATKIWVWDKTKQTLGTVRKLAGWMESNHFRVVTQCMKKDFENWQPNYVQKVMNDLGWVWPDSLDEMDAQWPVILRKTFQFKVRVFARETGVRLG